MKLTEEQLNFIKTRREQMDRRELEIRREARNDLYKEKFQNEYHEIMSMHDERRFYNLFMRLHNVQVKAEKEAN